MPRLAEKSFLTAWLHPAKARIKTPGAATQYVIALVILVAAWALAHTYLGSRLGELAAVGAILLISFRANPGQLETRLLYALLVTVVWVPLGRILEFYGYGLASLLLYLGILLLIFLGGRRT